MADLVTELIDALGAGAVVTDPELTATHANDWTGRFVGCARVVVAPADASEVLAVMEVCRSRGTAIVPQGGNTGLVGGSVPCTERSC